MHSNQMVISITPRVRAAQYLRVSTEHQRYSTENQSIAIAAFAYRRNYEIVETYRDEGRSGLTFEGRDALKRLISDVQSGNADYAAVLVLDVSRWGRFQDADESAYYEYVCRRSGIEVIYCGEEFENDGSLFSSIIKTLKRAMAAEYSRELSGKVFAGQCHLITKGFRQGGMAGYALQRRLIDQDGNPKGILQKGEIKALQTDRVILEPGDPKEVEAVRFIFRMFVEFRVREVRIARRLNEQGSTYIGGRPWNSTRVSRILTNPKYAGHNVYNRTSYRLKKRRLVNSPDLWIRADDAFESIVSPEMFAKAQEISATRYRRLSKEDMLHQLKLVLKSRGALSETIINSYDMIPSAGTYKKHFGGLVPAYRLIGYTPRRTDQYINLTGDVRARRQRLLDRLREYLQSAGFTAIQLSKRNVIAVQGRVTITIVVLRCIETDGGLPRWIYEFNPRFNRSDITVIARLNKANAREFDYFIVPRVLLGRRRLLLRERNDLELDACRCERLVALRRALIKQVSNICCPPKG